MARKRLGEILVEKGLITAAQLEECLVEQKKTKEYLGVLLVRKKIVKEEELMRALSDQFNIPFVHLKDQNINWDVCMKYFPSMTTDQNALAIHSDEKTVLVAVRDPLDTISLSNIEFAARPLRLRLVLVCESELQDFIKECHRRSRSSLKQLLDEE